MKPQKKKASLLEIRKAYARIREINQDPELYKPKKLDKQIFVGHWRFFVVRADIMRSSIGTQVANIVLHCNHWVLGQKKDAKSYRCSTEIRLNPTKSGFQGGQYLQPLSQEEWENANLPEFFKKKWFETVTTQISVGTRNIPRVHYFPKVPTWMLEYKYKRAYITEVGIPNGDLETELKRLCDFMEKNDGYTKLGKNQNRDEWDLSIIKKKTLEKLGKREACAEID